MTKIHDCFGKFCETAHLMPAFGGMPEAVNLNEARSSGI
jgi:hypothetical protein